MKGVKQEILEAKKKSLQDEYGRLLQEKKDIDERLTATQGAYILVEDLLKNETEEIGG